MRYKSFTCFCFMVLTIIFSTETIYCASDDHGPALSLGFSGSSNDQTWIFKLDTLAGYKFNNYFEIDLGLPIYFIHATDSETVDGLSSKNGIGNASIGFRFMVDRPKFYFSSTATGTAPTGSTRDGFSTGRATIDWTNYFEYHWGRLTPFGSAGIANTVSDTNFFTRPFASLGLVGHFDGGMTYHPSKWLSITGSGYAVTPSGNQKLYSRIARRYADGSGTGLGEALSSGYGNYNQNGNRQNRGFENEVVTIGSEDIAKDHGISGWINLSPTPNTVFEIGFSRSIAYQYNSLFFSLRYDFSSMLRGKNK
jgi:hypothetical protein